MSTETALTVLAWGNESRGDDGAGPFIARKIGGLGIRAIDVIEDFQLQIEHVMDLQGDAPVLFVDASVDIEPGFRLEKLAPRLDATITTHAVSPQGLLGLYERTLSTPAPEAYLLHIHGSEFELGAPLSDETRRHAESAWRFLETVFNEPVELWQPKLDEKVAA